MKSHRSRYDSFIILLFATQREHLLPKSFRDQIPASTASSWRNNSYDFIGTEFRSIQQESLDWYELMLKYNQLRKTILLLTRVWITISSHLEPALHKLKKEVLIDQVQLLLVRLPQKIVFKLARISSATFYFQLQKLKYNCSSSPLNLCFKKHPLQLSHSEIKTMKEFLSNPAYFCWPIASIAYFAQRNKLLFASLSSWYKYSILLGFKRTFPKKTTKTTGFISTRPNQFIHVDTTFFSLAEDRKAAITFVSDNFSKMILGWSISFHNNALNVKAALAMAIETIRKYYPRQISTTLVADGGSENHAVTIEQLIALTPTPEITKIIARKDIAFSNSPIEAIHKIMKRYLRYHNPKTIAELSVIILHAIQDYTIHRPHHALQGYTPMEVYAQKLPSMDFTEQKLLAKTNRILSNRKNSCPNC